VAASPLLEPALLARLEALSVLVRRPVKGHMGGQRRSLSRGRSPEFADFRNYAPGDDFRLIDWNAYARLDRFMLRLFVAEEEMPMSVFIDLSGSMDWGVPNKAYTAKRLAAALAYVALSSLDRVRLTVFAEGPTSGGAPYRGRHVAHDMFSRIASFPVGGKTDYSKLVAPISRQRPGMSILITDGLGESPLEPALSALQLARQEGAVLQVLAPQEIDLDWAGDALLVDAETGVERELTATPATQAAYRLALARRTEDAQRIAQRRGLRFVRLTSDQSIDDMVQRTLRRIGLLG